MKVRSRAGELIEAAANQSRMERSNIAVLLVGAFILQLWEVSWLIMLHIGPENSPALSTL